MKNNIVKVVKGDGYNIRQFHSKSEFFQQKGRVVIKEFDDYITIRLASLMDTCKSNTITIKGSGWYSVSVSSEADVGDYIIDEDSNEDCLYLYKN